MSNEQETKMQLPKLWRALNFYSLNLAYGFAILFASLQIGSVKGILVKAFKEDNYDALNGWVLILLLVTAAGSGILGYVRMKSVKSMIDVLENKNNIGDQKPL